MWKKQFIISPEPYALDPKPHLYAAVTRDEGNAADGRFPPATTVKFMRPLLAHAFPLWSKAVEGCRADGDYFLGYGLGPNS